MTSAWASLSFKLLLAGLSLWLIGGGFVAVSLILPRGGR